MDLELGAGEGAKTAVEWFHTKRQGLYTAMASGIHCLI
jgi:hypothetical protein